MYKINKVKPVLYRGKNSNFARQLVAFFVDGLAEPVFLSYLQVKSNTNVRVEEVEILKGCDVRFDFYDKGEVMFSGKVCESDNLVKDFWIETPESIRELRVTFEGSLPAKLVLEVFTYTGYSRKKLVGFDTGKEKATFISRSSLSSSTGLEEDFHVLEGSYIAPEYYEMGDEIWEEQIYGGYEYLPVGSGNLLKDLNLRIDGSIDQLLESADSEQTQRANRKLSGTGKK